MLIKAISNASHTAVPAFACMLVAAAILVIPAVGHAETLIIDGIDATADAPAPGMQKSAVEEALGTPRTQTQPVGDPPISSWEYDQFIVFFEYDRVIHSVAKR